MKIRNSQKGGFTLVEIMIVVAIIGLLAAIAIPNFVRARTTSQMNACINNLRQIDGAKQQWALETKQQGTTAPTYGQIRDYMKSAVVCPAGGSTATTFANSYNINAVDVRPTCKVAGTSATYAHVLPADTSS